MPQIHDTDNYTVPGGIKLFFNDGTGEVDLGNMVDVSIGRDTNYLEHYTNRPGLRRKDKVIALQESISIEFALDEPVVNNFKLFFKGDNVVNQSAGTTAVVDHKAQLGTSYSFVSLTKKGPITSYSARQFLDYCYLYNGSTYVNNSVEADTSAGTPFAALADDNDILYIGKKNSIFKKVVVDVQTASSGYTSVTWKYWNGSTWSTLSTSGTADLSADASVTWTAPTDWAKTTVNGVSAYWVKIEQTAASPATPATLNSIGRGALVENTDYAIDLGTADSDARVRGVSGGALVDGEEIMVSFTYPTVSAQITNFVMVGSVEGSARLEVHPQSGRGLSFDIEIPKCQINSKGNLSLNDQEFMKVPFELVVLDDTDNTPTYPYGRILVYDTQ
jgi:hypothetical protein